MTTASPPPPSPSAPFYAERRPDPCALVLFGITGDLAKRKLIPGLYNLFIAGHLPAGFALIGVGRSVAERDELVGLLRDATARFSRTPIEDDAWDRFAA